MVSDAAPLAIPQQGGASGTSNVIAKSIDALPDGLSIALELIELSSANYDKNKGKVASIIASSTRIAKAQQTEGGASDRVNTKEFNRFPSPPQAYH